MDLGLYDFTFVEALQIKEDARKAINEGIGCFVEWARSVKDFIDIEISREEITLIKREEAK